jgi:choline dehydrogenase-like flavoprotein
VAQVRSIGLPRALLDGIADDWPFTYEDLEPYYEQIEREIGYRVSG